MYLNKSFKNETKISRKMSRNKHLFFHLIYNLLRNTRGFADVIHKLNMLNDICIFNFYKKNLYI